MQRFSRFFNNITTKADESLPKESKWIVEERSIDENRPLRVVVIGSGISGIMASVRFRQRVPNLDVCVYERNEDVGGTWLENRYPGCACGMRLLFDFLSVPLLGVSSADLFSVHQDIPAHTYQASFEPNKEWSTFYAAAPEICQYWRNLARKFGCQKHIKFKQQVIQAVWNEESSIWQLQVSIPHG